MLVASRAVFELFSPDEEPFAGALLWVNLLMRPGTSRLWEGLGAAGGGHVWGSPEME